MQRLISTIRHDFNSVIVLHSQMETLREQLKVLEDGLTISKARCKTALQKIGIDAEFVPAMIKKAESHPQENPNLQRVCRSSKKVQEKMKELREMQRN